MAEAASMFELESMWAILALFLNIFQCVVHMRIFSHPPQTLSGRWLWLGTGAGALKACISYIAGVFGVRRVQF
ncbi:hypothetical protein [Marinobacter sp. V034]|uniref:hypothetical protein n=1 Tax=Marinobacter sp. V034 TaxID=3459610 RepID=UPI00404496D3